MSWFTSVSSDPRAGFSKRCPGRWPGSRAAIPSLAAPPGAMAYITTCDSSLLSLAWAQQNCCAATVSSRAAIPWVASHCCSSLVMLRALWFIFYFILLFVAWIDLELTLILLPLPSQCWNYRHKLPLPASVHPFMSTSCLHGSQEKLQFPQGISPKLVPLTSIFGIVKPQDSSAPQEGK